MLLQKGLSYDLVHSYVGCLSQVMKIKLQPASATDLPAHNPILPAAAITQVMLIALPAQVLCVC